MTAPLVERLREVHRASSVWLYLAESSGRSVPVDTDVLRILVPLLEEAAAALEKARIIDDANFVARGSWEDMPEVENN